MKTIIRFCVTCILCIFIIACSSSSSHRIGQSSYSAQPDTADVLVFTSESQVKDKFEIIGMISHNNPGKYRVLTLESAIEPLKRQARQLGANAIIIDKSYPVKSGIVSTGIYVEARAILILPKGNK